MTCEPWHLIDHECLGRLLRRGGASSRSSGARNVRAGIERLGRRSTVLMPAASRLMGATPGCGARPNRFGRLSFQVAQPRSPSATSGMVRPVAGADCDQGSSSYRIARAPRRSVTARRASWRPEQRSRPPASPDGPSGASLERPSEPELAAPPAKAPSQQTTASFLCRNPMAPQ
jgi:hypothetical protein